MADELHDAIRTAAKGSGWSAKRDTLSKRVNDWVLAVNPRRGAIGTIEFRAKPDCWDRSLWSILQIEGNEKPPPSFYFIGAFTCDVPALIQKSFDTALSNDEIAKQMVNLTVQGAGSPNDWQNYNLAQAMSNELPIQPYRYHMTRVVERMSSDDRQMAIKICESALSGDLDLRHTFHSVDRLSAAEGNGRRPSKSFFELALIWMGRN